MEGDRLSKASAVIDGRLHAFPLLIDPSDGRTPEEIRNGMIRMELKRMERVAKGVSAIVGQVVGSEV